MNFSVKNINWFVMLKIPSAYISGVRLQKLNGNISEVVVRKRWINQNPFQSMYWATQGMASELATGVLVMKSINESGKKISMLVTRQEGVFTKKALGKITFTCDEGEKVNATIQEAIKTDDGCQVTLSSTGYDEKGEIVATFHYEWSVKLKS